MINILLPPKTSKDLVRYHGKLMIVDGTRLFLLGFNLTRLDIDKSRSFGVATGKLKLVQEAVRLFAADFDRRPYTGGVKDLLVSPVNARERLTAFLKGAKKQLLIYDSGLTDNAMLRILQDRVKKGVEVRIIGKVEKGHDLSAEPFPGRRQHVRCVVRDRRAAFVGSQSLRKLELDARREIGVLVREPQLVKDITEVFESDWAETEAGHERLHEADIVLVGLSRTSKTPTSFYLAQEGYKVANVPIVPGIALPEELFEIDQHKVVCLNIEPEVLQKTRKVRQKNSGLKPSYSDLRSVFAEVEYVWELTRKHRSWKVVDTTNKSIEETAWEIVHPVFGEEHDEYS